MPDSSLFMAVLLQQAFSSLQSSFVCVQTVHILPIYNQASITYAQRLIGEQAVIDAGMQLGQKGLRTDRGA